jgi:hypothetical protein
MVNGCLKLVSYYYLRELKMARVFISHSSRDNESAEQIKNWLKKQGFETPFLDYDKHAGIPPGADWEKTLYREIEHSEAVIIIQTPNWLESKWCFAEFTQARALGKSIFPIIETPSGGTLISSDIQALDLHTDREGGLEQLSRQLTQIALDAQGGFGWDSSRAPYPGLLAFQEEDAALYFGRDNDIRRLIERLDARRAQGGSKLIALLGASGSGKSSLLRAGVIPRIKRAASNWIVLPVMRPQVRPVDELARCLAVALGEDSDWRKLRNQLNGDNLAQSLSDIATDLRMQALANEAQILLPIDQGEELFGAADLQQAKLFCEILNLALSDELPFMAIITIRSDYLGVLQSAEHLTARFEEFSIGPMPLARIAQIIEGPARVAGLCIDEAFVHQAVQDAKTEDALPLLAFALRELYDSASDDNYLSLDEYNALGDKNEDLTPLENSVRKAADNVLLEAQPDESEQTALREAFVPAMVRVNEQGEYVRQPARWSELPNKSHRLLELLAKARLLIISQDDNERIVEVAHEALLRKWPRLRLWLDDAREFLTGKQQLSKELSDWQNAKNPLKASALLTGLKLNRARGWLAERPHQLSTEERAFVLASIETAEADELRKMRSRRNITRVSIAAALTMAGIAALAGWQWREATIAQDVASKAQQHAEKQTIDARKAKDEAVPWIIRATWRSGAEYEPNVGYVDGIREIIKHADSIINLDKVRFLAPFKIFASGPHESKFNWQSKQFGHYNPEFIRWASDHLIPGAKDPVFRSATQSIYDVHLKTLAHAYCSSYQALHHDPEALNTLKTDYLERLSRGDTDDFFFGEMFYQYSGAMERLKPGLFGTYSHVAAPFWIRREVDGTADEFIHGIRKVLETYDKAYSEECMRMERPLRMVMTDVLPGVWVMRNEKHSDFAIFNDNGGLTIKRGAQMSEHSWQILDAKNMEIDGINVTYNMTYFPGNFSELPMLEGEQSAIRLHPEQQTSKNGTGVDGLNVTSVTSTIGNFSRTNYGQWQGPGLNKNLSQYIEMGRSSSNLYLYDEANNTNLKLNFYVGSMEISVSKGGGIPSYFGEVLQYSRPE